MPRATKTTPSPNTRPMKARPWPTQAGRVADDLAIALSDIGRNAKSMSKQAERIDRWAELGVEAVREGNYVLAIQLFQDIRNATATMNHTSAGISGAAGGARSKLAAARAGDYGSE